LFSIAGFHGQKPGVSIEFSHDCWLPRKLKRGIGRMEFTSKVLVRKAMAEMGAMG